MGCTMSKAEAPERPQQDFAATGAGSIILAAPGKRAPAIDDSASDDLLQTRGGSMIVGRKEAGAWEPGTEIVRPDNTATTQVAFLSLPNGNKLQLAWAAVSLQGKSPRPPHKPNQDSYVVSIGLGSDPDQMHGSVAGAMTNGPAGGPVALFAVMDGHGPKGEDVSHYCRINIPDLTVRHPSFLTNPFDALCASFETAHRKYISSATARTGSDAQVSGSTAVAIMLQGKEWVCANVGDSRAALGTRADSPNGAIQCVPLSSDHKPLRPDERARILKAGARILSEKQLGIEGGDADKLYVCRVANGAIRYGVLFTRSIGDADAHANLGLSAEPEIRRGVLDPLKEAGAEGGQDAYLLLATDGVWDHLTEDDVNECIMRVVGKDSNREVGEDIQAAAAALCELSRSKWEATGDKRRDDITIVLVGVREIAAAADKGETTQVESKEGDSEGKQS